MLPVLNAKHQTIVFKQYESTVGLSQVCCVNGYLVDLWTLMVKQ